MRKLKQLTIPILAAMLLSVVVPVSNVYAASANFYISPSSSSVTKGNTVTVQVRINSGSDRMDTAQARINFPGSKLQYVSYSAGSFSTFTTSSGSGYFEYVGAVLGGSISGDKLLFSVTLKATNTGTASLSLSNYQAAYSGSNLSVSASGGSVAISKPSSGGGSTDSGGGSTTDGSGSTTFGSGGTSNEQQEQDPPPKISGKPNFEVTQSTISFNLGASEPSKLVVNYKLDGTKKFKTVRQNTAKKQHSVTLGQDKPLQAGKLYLVNVTLIDKKGNKSKKYDYKVRTKGVDYSVKITDNQGQPLIDHPVELHSEPIETTTDENGIATFPNVTPGEHTLVLEIDGITIRQPVKVGQPVVTTEGSAAEDDPVTVELPFSLATHQTPPVDISQWNLLIAGVTGALIMFTLRLSQTRRLVHAIATHAVHFAKKYKNSDSSHNEQ